MMNAPGKLPGAAIERGMQTVMVVNGSHDVLELLESVLDAGRYEVVFLESAQHAYSQIRRVQPHLVILCVRIEDLNGFQILSMLKMDPETRAIPVLTYTTEFEGQDGEGEFSDPPEDDDNQMFAVKPMTALRMN